MILCVLIAFVAAATAALDSVEMYVCDFELRCANVSATMHIDVRLCMPFILVCMCVYVCV